MITSKFGGSCPNTGKRPIRKKEKTALVIACCKMSVPRRESRSEKEIQIYWNKFTEGVLYIFDEKNYKMRKRTLQARCVAVVAVRGRRRPLYRGLRRSASRDRRSEERR